jgi:hypothetical protein
MTAEKVRCLLVDHDAAKLSSLVLPCEDFHGTVRAVREVVAVQVVS